MRMSVLPLITMLTLCWSGSPVGAQDDSTGPSSDFRLLAHGDLAAHPALSLRFTSAHWSRVPSFAFDMIDSLQGGFAAAAEEVSDSEESETRAPADEEELAKQSQNPVANLISVPFQNNTSFKIGPEDRTQNVLNIQPVYPFHLSENWNLITRWIVPLVYQPDVTHNSSGDFGLGDFNPQMWFSPASSADLVWGLGGAAVLPTATNNNTGLEKWSAGPSAVVVWMPGKWVIGAVTQNVWSFAGDDDRSDVNSFLLQYFVNYNIANGWFVKSAPILTANWRKNSDDAWTVPFGGGFGKLFRFGKLPVNTEIQAFSNVERPSGGPEWTLRFQLSFLFPK